MKSHTIISAIGNTPLVKLRNLVGPEHADIFVKLEYFNPTGSYKDRMALSLIEEAEKRGTLKAGMTVIEATGGSTGTSLALVCAVKGYKFVAISSDAFAKEKLQSIKVFGGELELMASEGGKTTPDLVPRMMERAKALSADARYYWTRQLENDDVIVGYYPLGKEIIAQLGGVPDAFCGATGSGYMLMGVARMLRQQSRAVQIVALEPAESPMLTKGTPGKHKVDGISVGVVTKILKDEGYDEAMTISESEARSTARLLASQEGIFAGTSTGLNVAAASQLAKRLGPGKKVVTIASDSGMKYLSEGLFS